MHILSGIIKCEICGKAFNFKNNTNNNYVYICQTRKNYGVKKCDCRIVKEQFLIDIIETHCRNLGKDYTIGKTKLFVKQIKIDNERIKILYKDGTYSEITQNSIHF